MKDAGKTRLTQPVRLKNGRFHVRNVMTYNDICHYKPVPPKWYYGTSLMGFQTFRSFEGHNLFT